MNPPETSEEITNKKILGKEAPVADVNAGNAPRQKERHVGFAANRLHPNQGNPREVTFAREWREENQYGQLQHLIPDLTERDEQVAATIIQWLGSNVGMCFLHDVIRRGPEIREWLSDVICPAKEEVR